MNYKKEYKKYLTSSVLDTANNKITSHSFITAFAVYLGLSNFAIGIYAVLDTITNIIQIFAAPLFSKIGQSRNDFGRRRTKDVQVSWQCHQPRRNNQRIRSRHSAFI